MFRRSIAIAIAFLVFAFFLIVGVKTQIQKAVRCAYIEWGLAQSVIEYSEEHDGEMPDKLEDLRPYFRKGEGNLSSLKTLDESAEYVKIDFLALKNLSSDPIADVFTRSRLTLPVIVRNGRALILEYISNQAVKTKGETKGGETKGGERPVAVTLLGSDSGFGIQRYELGNATALNRRRHECIQRIDDNGRRRMYPPVADIARVKTHSWPMVCP